MYAGGGGDNAKRHRRSACLAETHAKIKNRLQIELLEEEAVTGARLASLLAATAALAEGAVVPVPSRSRATAESAQATEVPVPGSPLVVVVVAQVWAEPSSTMAGK